MSGTSRRNCRAWTERESPGGLIENKIDVHIVSMISVDFVFLRTFSLMELYFIVLLKNKSCFSLTPDGILPFSGALILFELLVNSSNLCCKQKSAFLHCISKLWQIKPNPSANLETN